MLDELHNDGSALEDFNAKVISSYSTIDTTNLLCIVTESYLFELFIFYASVKRAWPFFPWKIYAFSPETSTVSRINEMRLPNIEAFHFPFVSEGGWGGNAALKIELVERSGIEKGIVSDIDNIFLAETPELQLLLQTNDFVFIGAPHSKWIVQTSLWSFRRSPAAIRFAKKWAQESEGREFADASGFPFALREHNDQELSITILAKAKKDGSPHHQCPYDVQANILPFKLTREMLGYSEAHMGRAKVIHFGGLRSKGSESVKARMTIMEKEFSTSSPVFPYYLECTNEAANIMGMAPNSSSRSFLRNLFKNGLSAFKG